MKRLGYKKSSWIAIELIVSKIKPLRNVYVRFIVILN